jgi:hypothetical protein
MRVEPQAPQGVRAVADQKLYDGGQREERRVFPAAVRRGEQPAVADVHPGGAEQYRDQRQRDVARVDAEYQQHAADQFRREGRIAEGGRQAERAEVLRGAGQGEREVLEQRVRDEHRAEAEAQQQCADLDASVVGRTGVGGHGGSPDGWLGTGGIASLLGRHPRRCAGGDKRLFH